MSRFESHHLTILKRPPPSFSRRPIRFRTFSAADRAVTRVRKLIPFWARVRRLRLSRTVKGFLEIDGSLVAAVLRFVLCSQEKRALAGSEESGSFLSASLHGDSQDPATVLWITWISRRRAMTQTFASCSTVKTLVSRGGLILV